MTAVVIRPSSWLSTGIQIRTINNFKPFKFTKELGDRLQALLDKKKVASLTPEEAIELEGIGELDQIFTYINAMLAAQP